LLTLRGHAGPVHDVAVSQDSNRMVTASFDGTAQVYALGIRELMDLAHARVTRRPPALTPGECKRYFQSETCPPLP
jgi:WD40 repeat protein